MNFNSKSWSQQIRSTWLQIARRRAWFPKNIRASVVLNTIRNFVAFGVKSSSLSLMPSIVKIDISPICSLACPTCLHADPVGRGRPLLSAQKFRSSDRMSIDQYRKIIEQITGKSLAVSLFYYGDPLAHPKIVELIKIAEESDLAVHITTHFSYNLSEARIAAIVDSGLSHITVAIDGATQKVYEVTRVGGRLDWVMRNLRTLIAYRNSKGMVRPVVEVQHIRHPHHPNDECNRVESIVRAIGIDDFVTFPGIRFDRKGDLYNVVDSDIVSNTPGKPLNSVMFPRCHWPYSSTVIKFDGRVIPCCMWREGHQYATGGDDRSVGNIFEDSLSNIWTSEKYKKIRDEVANPQSISQTAAEMSFCSGCFRLYDSTPLVGSDDNNWHAR